jgi:hypothetical protein
MRMLGGIGVLLALLCAGGGWAVAADAPALPPAVTVEGGRLSVHLTKVPLAQVLELILERSAVDPDGDQPGTTGCDRAGGVG